RAVREGHYDWFAACSFAVEYSAVGHLASRPRRHLCNLYSMTKTQEAMRRLFKVQNDRAGNLPSLPDIFPDQLAPVVCNAKNGERSLELMRWGFPPPPNLGTRPVTNVRNVKSAYWRGWLKPAYRCLVPATSFCEYTDSQPKVPHWFA